MVKSGPDETDSSYHPYNLRPTERVDYYPPSPLDKFPRTPRRRRNQKKNARKPPSRGTPKDAVTADYKPPNSAQTLPERPIGSISGAQEQVSYHAILPFVDEPRNPLLHLKISSLTELVSFAINDIREAAFSAVESCQSVLAASDETGPTTEDSPFQALGTMLQPVRSGLDSFTERLTTLVDGIITANEYAIEFFDGQVGRSISIDALWALPIPVTSRTDETEGPEGRSFGDMMAGVSDAIRGLIEEVDTRLDQFQSFCRALEAIHGDSTSASRLQRAPPAGNFTTKQLQTANEQARSTVEGLRIFRRALANLRTEKEELLQINTLRELDSKFMRRAWYGLKDLREGDAEESIGDLLLETLR